LAFDLGRSPVYRTEHGSAWQGDSVKLMRRIPDESVDLVCTSPPYALNKKKNYGNVDAANYIRWFRPFAKQIYRVLKPSGSLVLNIGGSWNPGTPTRSLYPYELLIELCRPGQNRKNPPIFHLAQEFFWFNPAKIPNPAQWVTIERIRVKDAVEPIWWLGKTESPKSSNRKVLRPYSENMKRLISTGKYNRGVRPSGWNVSDKWSKDNGGAIPPNFLSDDAEDLIFNFLAQSNTSSNDTYRQRLRERDGQPHPATFPSDLPKFFIEMLTDPGDVILDPFAGSNTTGFIAETLNRRWCSIEKDGTFLADSRLRWQDEEVVRG
jgi:DNA modification methylase